MEKWTKTAGGIEKLYEVFGNSGPIAALFENVNFIELFLINFIKTGSISTQLVIEQNYQTGSVSAELDDLDLAPPKPKRAKKERKNEKFEDLFRQIYKSNSGIKNLFFQKLKKFDDPTLRFIFGLKGAKCQDVHFRLLVSRLAEFYQTGSTGFNSANNVTKLKILSSDANQSNFVSICGIQLQRGNYEICSTQKILPLSRDYSIYSDLRQIALGISLNKPVLVSGPIGNLYNYKRY